MKKLLSIFVSLVLLSMPLTAVAEEPKPSPMLSPKYMSGKIVSEREIFNENSDENSNKDSKRKIIEVYSQMSDSTVILNVLEDTYIIDAVSGKPTDLSMRKNDTVSVYYGPVETRSLPPQSNAVAIICNIPQDFAPLHYTLVEEIEKIDDGIKITANEGSLIITLKNDTPISFYRSDKNDEDAVIDGIDKGSELLLWYSMVAMSYPGQTTATKAVILEREQAEGNGQVTMVPLRAMAEANGYELEWDGETKSITVSKDIQTYILTLGENQYGEVQLEAAPELRDSVTYVPLSFFEDVLNIAL